MIVSSPSLLSFLGSLSNLVPDLTRLGSVGGLKEKISWGTYVQHRVVLFIVSNYRYLCFVECVVSQGECGKNSLQFLLGFLLCIVL